MMLQSELRALLRRQVVFCLLLLLGDDKGPDRHALDKPTPRRVFMQSSTLAVFCCRPGDKDSGDRFRSQRGPTRQDGSRPRRPEKAGPKTAVLIASVPRSSSDPARTDGAVRQQAAAGAVGSPCGDCLHTAKVPGCLVMGH